MSSTLFRPSYVDLHSCLLIAFKMAEKITQKDIKLDPSQRKISQELISSFWSSMHFGCEIHRLFFHHILSSATPLQPQSEHKMLQSHRDRFNFTVPRAIRATGRKFRELDYVVDAPLESRLVWRIHQAVKWWSKQVEGRWPWHKPYRQSELVLVLLHLKRCLLIVYQPAPLDSLAFFDSHNHDATGAFICIVPVSQLHSIAPLLCQQAFPESLITANSHFHPCQRRPIGLYEKQKRDTFELSCIEYRNQPYCCPSKRIWTRSPQLKIDSKNPDVTYKS